jgi:hypothetical protein
LKVEMAMHAKKAGIAYSRELVNTLVIPVRSSGRRIIRVEGHKENDCTL